MAINYSLLRETLVSWLSTEIGRVKIIEVNFIDEFVEDNVISTTLTVDGAAQALDAVAFSEDNELTLSLLIREIQKNPSIKLVDYTEAGKIQIHAIDPFTDIDIDFEIVGGDSQTDFLTEVVQDAASFEVFSSHQSEPRSVNPYATFYINSVTSVGQDEIVRADPISGNADSVGYRRLTVSVQLFALENSEFSPIEEATKAWSSLETYRVVNLFKNAGFGIAERLQLNDLTDMSETEYMKRATFDFYLTVFESNRMHVNFIENVKINSTFSSLGDDNLLEEEFEIN
jgi:hypothetical protein